jgi:hypothetical protein
MLSDRLAHHYGAIMASAETLALPASISLRKGDESSDMVSLISGLYVARPARALLPAALRGAGWMPWPGKPRVQPF